VTVYRQHFALTQHPFSNEVEPEELFPATAAKELEVRLNHLLEMRGVGLVTGDSGSGKTSSTRRVLAKLHASLYRVIYVCLTTGNVLDLYKTIAWEMGLSVERSRASLFRQIKSEVSRLVSESRCRPVLIVDEAHHLRPEVLEDLRLLTNYKMDAENRLCLLLLGQTELRRRLAMAVHEALAQRIVVRYHLPALTRDEIPDYLAHRLRLAGTELALFDPTAQEALFQATGGLPRKVNLLAHHALFAAALARARYVSADHVQAALPEVA
jgi:general secretion pathway protein A